MISKIPNLSYLVVFGLIVGAFFAFTKINEHPIGGSKKRAVTQTIDSTLLERADSLMQLGIKRYEERNFPESAVAFKSAHKLYEQETQWEQAIFSIVNLSKLVEGTYQSRDSLYTVMDIAKSHTQKLPDTAYALSYYYQRLSQLSGRENRVLDALFFLRKGLSIIQKNAQEETASIDKAGVLQQLASIELDLLNYNKAAQLYKNALELSTDKQIQSLSRSQLFFINITLRKYEDAETQLKIIEQENLMEDAPLFISYDFYNDLISYYTETKRYKHALETITHLDRLIATSPYKEHFANWFFNQRKAALYYHIGEYENVIKTIALEQVDENLVLSSIDSRSYDYIHVAAAHYKLGNRKETLQFIQSGINLFLPPEERTNNFYKERSYDKAAVKSKFFGLLELKANIAVEEYKRTTDLKFKTIALHTIKELHKIIATIGDYSKEDIFLDDSSFKSIYETYLDLTYENFNETKEKELFFNALQIIDESKSNAVAKELEAIKKTKVFGNVPVELLQKEKTIKNILDTLYVSQTVMDTQKISDSLSREFIQLKEILKDDYPAYYRVSYGTQATVKETLEKKFPDVNMLEYFFGNEFIYIFQKSKDSYNFDRVLITKQLNQAIDDYIVSIRNPNSKKYQENEKEVYEALFSKYINSNQATLFVLDDKLHLLPISAIITNQLDGKKTSPVFRINTLSQYFENQNSSEIEALIMAPFASHQPADGRQILSGSKKEAYKVIEQIGGEIKLNGEATKDAFLKNANDFSILHIATHANLDTINPLKSSIYFADSALGLPSESYLLAEELYNVTLTSDLITLSACETGLGKEIKGKGVQSLSNAFSYCGVPATLMSLWKIPDQQTSEIMSAFYKHLYNGKPKHEALQLAKSDYVQNQTIKSLQHPFYWAGFVISGDVRPLKSNSQSSVHWLIGGVLVLLGFGLYGYRRLKRAKVSA